jgi:hypothetical protein
VAKESEAMNWFRSRFVDHLIAESAAKDKRIEWLEAKIERLELTVFPFSGQMGAAYAARTEKIPVANETDSPQTPSGKSMIGGWKMHLNQHIEEQKRKADAKRTGAN